MSDIHWIFVFGGNAGVLSQASAEAITVTEFKNALRWSTLPEKAVDNVWKGYWKQLQAHVSASGGNFEYIM